MNNCSNCNFAFRGEREQLECRLNPPNTHFIQVPNNITRQIDQITISVFPPLKPNHWCSHHRLKNGLSNVQ